MSQPFDQIHAAILAGADPEVQRKLLRTVPGAQTVGVPVPQLRLIAKDFRAQNPPLTLEAACGLLDELCKTHLREDMLVGIFILGGFGRKAAHLPWARLAPWIAALDNWETCDQLASNVAGAVVAANPGLVDQLEGLTGSMNPWQRRFALATASELNHKGRTHPAETLRICLPLLGDREMTVRKAVAWALKEASKHAPDLIFEFLLEHGGEMHPSVLREAAEKLSPAQRTQLGTIH